MKILFHETGKEIYFALVAYIFEFDTNMVGI